MKRWVIFITVAILACILSWFVGYKSSLFKAQTEENAQVVLQEIKKVAKVVTTEAQFAEIYDYKHSYTNWPFEKKALVKVKAKALVGYDLDQLIISVNEDDKSLTINGIQDPELLALDHELEYYDLKEGLFITFSAQDLTTINENAKDFIKEKVLQSEVIRTSEQQKNLFIDLLRASLHSMGWNLIVEESSLLN